MILVVDDESESRTMLTAILTAEGYQVRAADGGELALASLAAKRPQLILLDIRMPGIDGFEVCRRLKERQDTCDIPVIFLSASGDVAEKVAGLRLGAVDFIIKPFRREELLARVRTHLELGMLRTRLEEEVAKRTAELRESEERFRTMADAAPVMIWVSGIDKGRNYFNKRWLEFTGRVMLDEVGSGWIENVHPDEREVCYTTNSSSFDDRRSFEVEFRLRRADGEYRWVLDRGVPRFAPNGDWSGYVGSCTDITEIKEAHKRALASQKLESLGLMAAGVAHDFGNLVGAIFGETDLALSEMSPGAPGRQNIERIVAAATHATGMVKTLMASASSGGESSTAELVNLSFAVEQILGLLKPSLSKRVVIRSSLSGDLPAVRGNVLQIRQVVMNLISNALEALCDKQGVITVTTEKVRLGPESAATGGRDLPNGVYARLKVEDTGCGMSAETCAKIFDQFFTTKSPGRGLGLSVAHGIVRSHGGAIRVESAPGKGTRFEVLFPCACPVGKAHSATPSAA